jgi:hypothetical protein
MPTNNKGLNQPVLSSPGWGTPLNDNAAIIDKALGSFTTISAVTGTVNLTLSQCQNMCIKTTTSAFLTNVTFVIPSGVAGQWVFTNQSATSPFSLIVKNASSGVSVMIPNGITRTVYSDGSIVFFVDTQSISTFQNLSIGTGFNTTGASCSGTNATVTFGGGFLISVGQVISIRGVTPAGYNGIWTVTASSAGSVTFVVPETLAAQSEAGILYYGAITGSTLNLSGRGAVSGVATQAEAEAGISNTTLMTPLRVEQHTLINDIGWGQSWVGVSRSLDTWYQNTTSRPIALNYRTNSGGNSFVDVGVSTSTFETLTWSDGSSGTWNAGFAIVPSQYYYRVRGTSIAGGTFVELR